MTLPHLHKLWKQAIYCNLEVVRMILQVYTLVKWTSEVVGKQARLQPLVTNIDM